jgi:hypothetical protein
MTHVLSCKWPAYYLVNICESYVICLFLRSRGLALAAPLRLIYIPGLLLRWYVGLWYLVLTAYHNPSSYCREFRFRYYTASVEVTFLLLQRSLCLPGTILNFYPLMKPTESIWIETQRCMHMIQGVPSSSVLSTKRDNSDSLARSSLSSESLRLQP